MREVPFSQTVAVSGTGNVIGTATPDFLSSMRGRGVLEAVLVTLVGASSAPTTMTCSVYFEHCISGNRATGDAAYSATATPNQYLVDYVTGLAIIEDVQAIACAPDPLAAFGNGSAIKVLPTGLGGGDVWVVNVEVRGRMLV